MHLFTQTKKCWNPGSDVAVDECMACFTGRSSDILTIKNKPISTGFKIWALAQEGYISHWIFHQKGKGPVGVKPPTPHLNKTNSVVVACLESLPKQPYCVWLDNLFISNNLLQYLHHKGYEAAGTARANSGMVEELIQKKARKKLEISTSGGLYSRQLVTTRK